MSTEENESEIISPGSEKEKQQLLCFSRKKFVRM